jgi:hypothetical protein
VRFANPRGKRILRRIRETTEKELTDDAPAFAESKLCVLYVESLDQWPKGFFAERMEELL